MLLIEAPFKKLIKLLYIIKIYNTMDNINDILLKYSGKEILVVLDNNKKVRFNAV